MENNLLIILIVTNAVTFLTSVYFRGKYKNLKEEQERVKQSQEVILKPMSRMTSREKQSMS